MMLKPPENAKLIDWPTSTKWFDESGILYSLPKSGLKQQQTTKEETLLQMEELRKLCGNKKTCMILMADSTAAPPKKEDRDWMAEELNSVTKAMAIIFTTPLSRMAANLFFGLKPATYPVKNFSNEADAKKWIKQYL